MTFNRKRTGLGGASVATVAATALLVAACGSSSSTGTASQVGSASHAAATSQAAGYAAPSAAATPVSTSAITIATAKGSDGIYLTGPAGRALYLWAADGKGKSSCSGACAKFWPPLVATSKPTAGSGVTAGDLGTITRTDGKRQVTYDGHPLYSFAEDSGKGVTKGQGSDGFGAKWWLVAPSGTAITSGGSSASGPAGAASSTSSSSAGGGY